MLKVISVCLLIGTVQSGGYAGGPSGGAGSAVGCSGASCSGGGSFSSGPDFNPILLQGQRGYPGIRARLNSRAFQYASTLVAGLLNSEIKKARIPPISQCIPMVQGCVNIYNLYVSRYRCPQRVVLYPAPPNRIVLQVQNVDLGVTGNLGGQVVVLLPIALSGIVQLNIHQATITVQLAIERGPRGPYVRLLSCDMQIGYADAYIENGGLVGDIVNSQFRSQISNQVRQMIPGQVCGQLPNIINEKLNSKLGALPQTIALQQMISLFGGALGLGGSGGGSGTCPSTCPKQPVFIPSTNPQPTQVAPAQVSLPASPVVGGAAPAPQIPSTAYSEGQRKAAAVRTLQQLQALRVPRHANITQHLVLPQGMGRQRMYAATIRAAGVGQYQSGQVGQVATYTIIGARPKYPPPPTVAVGPVAVQPPPDCSKCSAAGGSSDDPASFLRQIAGHLDMSKLNDLYLSLQYMQSYATSNDYTIDLTGEFSPYGQGGTPFGPFPTQFPYYGGQMAEFIVTDYTVNSLFYWLHRKQFLSFRIGPETPKIGELLKTTCSDDEDLDGGEVELDEEEARRKRRLAKEKAKYRLRRGIHSNSTIVVSIRPSRHVASHKSGPEIVGATNETTKLRIKRTRDSRRRRQEDTAGLADLGICFGDILPAVREKYPNKKIAVQIRTVRAPSVILSQAKGGMVTLDLIADADIYIDQTNTKVGTITIAATVVLTARIGGGRLSGTAEITQLHLSDRTGSLGLPQDALDNLGNLGKELLQKVANDGLQKGIAISIPQNLPLPIGIINPDVHIVEHGLHIATDFTISPSLLGGGGC